MRLSAPAPAPVIELEDVALCYRLAKQRIHSVKEYALNWVRGSLAYEELWALSGVSLSVRRGESVAFIGRNGAGKSTLLKVIAQVLKPSRGRAQVSGSVAPILQLGVGFDPELTGLENIYLSALLLGHPRREIAARVDGIIGFSELGDFIRSPIRNYSSGMQARLAFAVLTAWEPDILILDEVFAVGDAAFVEKSRGRIAALRAKGTTLLLVSHTAALVQENCERCVWLDAGRVRGDGNPKEILQLYKQETTARS